MSDANSTQTIQRQTFAASELVSCPALYVLQLNFFYEPNCSKIPTRSTSMAVGIKIRDFRQISRCCISEIVQDTANILSNNTRNSVLCNHIA